MNLYFCMWLDMHKYINTIEPISTRFIKCEMTRTHQKQIRTYHQESRMNNFTINHETTSPSIPC